MDLRMTMPRTVATDSTGFTVARRLLFARGLLGIAWIAAAASWVPTAKACGVSAVDGAWSCSLDEHEDSERRKWRLGAGGLHTTTRLKFDDGSRGDEQRDAIISWVSYAPTRRLVLQLSAGATLGGNLGLPDATFDIKPGPLVAFGVAWHFIEGKPFLTGTSTLSFSAATTRKSGAGSNSERYQALDLRAGVLFGTTFWDVLSPYAVARVFGGPVFWRHQGSSVLGTDLYHYQLGAGVALAFGKQLGLFVEGVPLGERSLSGGATLTL
jgi:hypothetical protein